MKRREVTAMIRDIKKDLDEMLSRNKLVIAEEYLDKISNIRIAIIGIGGVGSVVAEQLVRIGARNLTIVARGTYELGNVNRQIPATYLSVVSKIPKIYAMAQRLHAINPYLKVSALNFDVVKEGNKLHEKLKEQETKVLFNCVDEYYAQMIVAKLSDKLKIPMILGGVTNLGWNGIVSVYNPEGKIKYQHIFKLLRKNENNNIESNIDRKIKEYWLTSHKEEMPNWLKEKYLINKELPYPVITPVPWIVASFEVVEFVKLITHVGNVVFLPKAIRINTLNSKTELIDLRNTDIKNYLPWRP